MTASAWTYIFTCSRSELIASYEIMLFIPGYVPVYADSSQLFPSDSCSPSCSPGLCSFTYLVTLSLSMLLNQAIIPCLQTANPGQSHSFCRLTRYFLQYRRETLYGSLLERENVSHKQTSQVAVIAKPLISLSEAASSCSAAAIVFSHSLQYAKLQPSTQPKPEYCFAQSPWTSALERVPYSWSAHT